MSFNGEIRHNNMTMLAGQHYSISNNNLNPSEKYSTPLNNSSSESAAQIPTHLNNQQSYQQSNLLLHSPIITQTRRPEFFHSHSADDIKIVNHRRKFNASQLFNPLHFQNQLQTFPNESNQSSSTAPFDRTPQLISDDLSWRQPLNSDQTFTDFDDLTSTQISPRRIQNNASPSSSTSNSSQLINLVTSPSDLQRRTSAPSLAREARNARNSNNLQPTTRRGSVLSLRGQLPPGSFQIASGSTSPYPTTGTPSYRPSTAGEQDYTPSSSSSSASEMERLMGAAKLLDGSDYDSDIKPIIHSSSWTPQSALREATATYSGFEQDYSHSSAGWNSSFQPIASGSRPVFRQTASSANIPLAYPPDWATTGSNYSVAQDPIQNSFNLSPARISARPHTAPHQQDANDYYCRFSADALGQTLHPPRVSSSLSRNMLTRQSLPTLLTPPLQSNFDPTTQTNFPTSNSNLLARKQTIDYTSDEFPFGHQLDPNDYFAPGPKRRLSSFSDPPPPEPIIASKPLSKKALAAEKAQAKRDLKAGKGGATRFINYSLSDKDLLLSGVAPSGSSKRRRKELSEVEAEAEVELEDEADEYEEE